MKVLDHSVMQEAADALLDVGVSLPLLTVRLPFRDKPLRLSLVMRRPTLGAQIRIARKFLELGVSYEEVEAFSPTEEAAFMAAKGRELSEVIALCILRGYLTGKLFYRPLAWLIRWRVPEAFLLTALEQYVRLMNTRSFRSFIRYLEITNPMLSQQTKGS